MGLRPNHKQKFKMTSTSTTKKKGQLMQVKWKWCGKLNRNNLNTSFTRLVTFKSRHQSPPYNIFYDSPWGLHPNVTFPRDSQVAVPKLELLLSQTFGHSYLSQIKFGLRVQGQYFITLENIFSTMYNTLQLDLI
jgi:hypothetical protein